MGLKILGIRPRECVDMSKFVWDKKKIDSQMSYPILEAKIRPSQIRQILTKSKFGVPFTIRTTTIGMGPKILGIRPRKCVDMSKFVCGKKKIDSRMSYPILASYPILNFAKIRPSQICQILAKSKFSVPFTIRTTTIGMGLKILRIRPRKCVAPLEFVCEKKKIDSRMSYPILRVPLYFFSGYSERPCYKQQLQIFLSVPQHS
jgi:hypothetical protein